ARTSARAQSVAARHDPLAMGRSYGRLAWRGEGGTWRRDVVLAPRRVAAEGRASHRRLAAVTIGVVLSEDNALWREGVARLLERADGIDLVGTAADLAELEQLIAATDPHVV